MDTPIKVTGCSMGCMYATGPLSKCYCACKGSTHGLMVPEVQVAAKCSPSVEKRCKAGNEDGECSCACGGKNHGLYQTIENYDAINIVGILV